MTTCDGGRACMTETMQWTTMAMVIGVVVLVVAGLISIMENKRSMREFNESVEELCLDLFMDRDPHSEGLISTRVKRPSEPRMPKPRPVLSDEALTWLTVKTASLRQGR